MWEGIDKRTTDHWNMVMKMPISTGNEYGIQDVWSSNMEEEFAKIRKIVNKYSYIAMVRFVVSNALY